MAPPQIGRYEIKRELGAGGMAVVYLAHDPRFRRDVAIKVLPREFLHDRTFRERFEREAQTLAALEHSAIVPVYDYGEDDGQPYLVMRYMPGGSLADRIGQEPLSLQDCLPILTRIGAALDSAHRQSIIHRDVKPSNILFDREGEPYLSDFGIVKLTEATSQLTSRGMVGTPAYMAPEISERGGITPLVDVYALGVTLFQMLTGRLPYEADTPMGVLLAHASKPIPDIRALRPNLPDGVQTIIERGMAKDPMDRYPSTRELTAAVLAAAQSIVLPQPVRDAHSAAPDQATDYIIPDKETVDMLQDVPSLSGVEPTVIEPRREETAPKQVLPFSRAARLHQHRGEVLDVDWSDDGRLLVTGSADKTVQIWDAQTYAPLQTFKEHRKDVQCVSFHPTDSNFIACSSDSGRVMVWDILEDEYEVLNQAVNSPNRVAWSPDGKLIAYTSNDGRIILWDYNEGELFGERKKLHSDWATGVQFSPGGDRFATCGLDGKVLVLHTKSGKLAVEMNWLTGVTDLCWSPDSQHLALGTMDFVALVWDLQANHEPLVLREHTGWINKVEWSPNGALLASASEDGTVVVWSAATLEPLAVLAGHTDGVTGIAWSPDGRRLASCSRDQSVNIWLLE